ncbi:SusC/RagA family TonB-linked outer membrane protein [Bacteroidia bacterium]|nr:SusC/RagA family TonB-linked outer membrane protein [Bacteroidia bacterium]
MFAQQTTLVSGVVIGEDDGEPVIGAAVMVKGSVIGTVTDADGKFSLNAPANATLQVSYVGLLTQEVKAGQGLRITLRTDAQNLDEVMVVAYGTVKKSSFTGAATAIGSQQLEKRVLSNITSALEGNVPGLQVTSGMGAPGSTPSFRIRGFGSINAGTDPLIVLDGAIFNGSFMDINPNDIESLTVLKDAASTALYGSSAGNGVILVTTKTAKAEGGSHQLDFAASHGWAVRGIADYDRLDVWQYYPAQWEMMRNVYQYNNKQDAGTAAANASTNIYGQLKYNPFRGIANNQIVGTDGKLNPAATQLLYGDDLDWGNESYRTGQIEDYNISYSSKTDKSDSFASLNYRNEEGYVAMTEMQRYAGRINYNIQPVKWLKTGLSLSATRTGYTRNPSDDTGSSSSYNNLIRMTRVMAPIYPVYQHDMATGDYILDGSGEKIFDYNGPRLTDPGRHGLAESVWNTRQNKRDQLSARTYFDFNLYEGLKLSLSGNLETRNTRALVYENKLVGDGAPMGRMSINRYGYTVLQFNEMLSYNKTFGDHSMDVLFGHENYSYNYDYLYGMKQGEIASGLYEFGNFVTINSLSSSNTNYRKEGYLARANYNYKDKYYGSLSYRRDGSSRFYKDNRWGDFWSVGASWRIDQENFLQDVSWVNSLKLRASYGETGNDDTFVDGSRSYYPYMSLYGVGDNNRDEAGIWFDQYGNRNLKWETVVSSDAAVEFALFDRLSGSIEYFNRYSRNLIFDLPVQSSSGISKYAANIGRIENHGFEIDLNYVAFKNKDWRINVGLNATTIQNVIKELPQDEGIVDGTKRYAVGRSRYDYWLRQFVGVDPETGLALYIFDAEKQSPGADVFEKNGQTVTTTLNKAKYDYSGNAIPKVYGGFNTSIRYKHFELSAVLSYQLGGKLLDSNYQTLMNNRYGYAMHVDVFNAWKQSGDVTDVPRLDQTKSADFDGTSSRWLVSSDYLNIRNVNLSYTLPKPVLKPTGMKSARIGLGVENLAIFTARTGINPLESFSGTQYNSYVPARTVTATLNLSF